MPTVELIYDRDCHNVPDARIHLLQAFEETCFIPHWVEWDRCDPESPPYIRNYGSPTILVDGRDVGGSEPLDNISCCRLYVSREGGIQGSPTMEMIVSALQNAKPAPISDPPLGRSVVGWRGLLAVLPGILFALLPRFT